MRDEILGAPLEIEELVGVGRREGACPYYAARSAVNEAHVVLLPYQAHRLHSRPLPLHTYPPILSTFPYPPTYQALLHAGTRDALGVTLKDNVVVIDEAHNLLVISRATALPPAAAPRGRV